MCRIASLFLLHRLKRKHVRRRARFPPRSPKGVFFLHDKAPAHRALATQKKLAYLGLQCLDHPPYSPDLAPLDYHLFPRLKKNNRNVTNFRPTWRSLLLQRPGWTDNILNFFLSGLQKLEQWAKKFIELCGEYVE